MNDKKFIAVMAIATFILLFGGYFLIVGKNDRTQTYVASYSATDKEKPVAEVKQDAADIGSMKVADQKSADFTIKNTGNKSLQLSNIVSSCMCTVGQIIYRGKTSEEFGMHAQSDYLAEIAPGEQAILRMTYRPYIMPVSGAVEREVYVDTNDPSHRKLVFKVTANVQ